MTNGSRGSQRRTPTLDGASLKGPGRLVVLQGERVGRKITLEDETVTVGRAIECNARFDSAQLSRRHAEIRRIGPLEYEIVDLDSSNGTFVNGAVVEGSTRLRLGDKIRFGTEIVVQLTIHDPVEEQLLQRQRLETLGRLGAGIAHDFNNMLGAVLSNVEFLATLPGDTPLGNKDTRECLADIRMAATRAAELSQRLVAFARGESSADAIIDVSAICAEVALLLRRTLDRSIEVQTDIAPRLRVGGESLELHQVLMNLCLNARDAMPGGGTLSISAKRGTGSKRDAKGKPIGQVIVTVSDDGLGMDHATKSQIFEPFFTTKKSTGFGLGLATVRDIVTLLGGEVTVESAPGEGAKFVITMPAASRRAPRRVTSSIKPIDELVGHIPMTILLVDDEEVVRRSMMRVLTQAGHEVIEATGGGEAVALYASSERAPDLVLLDLDMPDKTGEETLDLLLELDNNCKVIMVSGHREREREMRLKETGALGFLRKPWQPGELLHAIEQAAEWPSEPERPTRH